MRKNTTAILFLFPVLCLAQQAVKNDSVHDFRKLPDAGKEVHKEINFKYDSKAMFRNTNLSVYDDFNGLTWDYLSHGQKYEVKKVTVDFEAKIFYDDKAFSRLFN